MICSFLSYLDKRLSKKRSQLSLSFLLGYVLRNCLRRYLIFIAALCCRQQAASVVQRRASWSAVRASKPSWPDSDSDTEDFLNIVSESHKAFVFTESTLEQFRRDHVEGAVIHDPAEYVGSLIFTVNSY